MMPKNSLSSVFVIMFAFHSTAHAQANICFPPARPFIPADIGSAKEYRDLIYDDFQIYFDDFSAYLQCLDQERARAFKEGQEVSEEYRRFFDQVVSDH